MWTLKNAQSNNALGPDDLGFCAYTTPWHKHTHSTTISTPSSFSNFFANKHKCHLYTDPETEERFNFDRTDWVSLQVEIIKNAAAIILVVGP